MPRELNLKTSPWQWLPARPPWRRPGRGQPSEPVRGASACAKSQADRSCPPLAAEAAVARVKTRSSDSQYKLPGQVRQESQDRLGVANRRSETSQWPSSTPCGDIGISWPPASGEWNWSQTSARVSGPGPGRGHWDSRGRWSRSSVALHIALVYRATARLCRSELVDRWKLQWDMPGIIPRELERSGKCRMTF